MFGIYLYRLEIFLLYGGLGIVLHHRAKIGKNVLIGKNVTIGGISKIKEVPVIGDNVLIWSGAKILGDVVIGKNLRVHEELIKKCDYRWSL